MKLTLAVWLSRAKSSSFLLNQCHGQPEASVEHLLILLAMLEQMQ